MLDKKKFYINGEWVNPINQNNYEVINPSNEEVCAILAFYQSSSPQGGYSQNFKGLKLKEAESGQR